VLVVYLQPFSSDQVQLLQAWGDSVRFWPRTWREQYLENEVADWWIEFLDESLLTLWMLHYADDSRIMRTLFD
jgi:hypothetical protein